ncbi:Kinesin-like protein KIF6 [Phytophthora citrophthora]|uniref:Kinesin-like protein n=1 Tax=Phytophthora citrophthora TaxID=4793 RepID=A0AAD9LQH9_9STRA|nr:Kinesin-like protein KIF6 [Phytophthora citrophthora]
MVKWHIGTYARLRPPRRGHDCAKFDLERVDDGRFNRTIIAFPPPDDDGSRMHLKQRDGLDFHFNDVFDPNVSQEQVFNEVCLDIVHSALDGYNGTILAYGQTGSGKTYTITGGEHYADRGIIPRVLSTIFEEFEKKPNMRYSCYISYLEIYNENVYDLLDRSHTDRPIEEWTKVLLMDDDEGDMHFRNLGVFEAVSEEEALNLLFLGNMNRVTSDTPMNQASSRSHSIFSVMIESRPVDSDMIVTSKLHLVDLAGSERVYKRDGTQRMRSEGKHINLSLHHLEQVIQSLRNKRNAVSRACHIPYRNSMLTSVLRGSLGGNCKSVFIATVNPESDFLDESISTCRFMQRCSEVAVEIAVNTEVDTEKRLEAVEKLNTELEATNFELQQRAVQLEKDIQDQTRQFAKKEEQWERRLAAAQEETQTALAAVKTARDRADQANKKIDWMQCEEMVERLLLTGDLPREELDKPRSEGDFQEARLLYDAVAQSIRELGMATALGCLIVLKENTFFASNTAAEIQELMSKQTRTVELLEQRLLEQKREAELLREQIQNITESQTPEGERKTAIPRSKSHTEAPRRHRSSRQQFENGRGTSTGGVSNSGSDSENDSEASTTHEYDRPIAARLPVKQGSIRRDRKASKRSEYSNPSISEETLDEDKQITLRGAALTTEDPVPPPRQSGSDMIRMRMELLRIGSLFVKYGRYGRPHVRFVWCSADLEYLNYRQVNSQVPKATIPTRSIVRICIGQDTRVFERAKQPERAPHCFSVEYEENRTLDLEIADGETPEVKKMKRSEWVDALQFLLKLKSKPSRQTPPRQDSTGSISS